MAPAARSSSSRDSEMPEGLERALDSRGAEIVGSWREGARGYVHARSPAGRLFGRWSDDDADTAVLRHEAHVAGIVGSSGPLRVPAVEQRGDDWLLEEGIESAPLAGSAAVAAVARAAARIPDLDLPEGPAPARRRGGIASSLRRLRILRSGVPLRDLVTARRLGTRLAAVLPTVMCHGDFQINNVLVAGDAAYVVDWELCGSGPAGSDLMQLWTSVADPADRDAVFEATVDIVGGPSRDDLARLRYVMTVRAIVDKLTAVQSFDTDARGAAGLLKLLPDLRAAALGG